MKCIVTSFFFFFFFNDTATTEIYTLSLHDALPISFSVSHPIAEVVDVRQDVGVTHHDALRPTRRATDRKSTRLNSSHSQISYAVFCLKKKKNIIRTCYSHFAAHLLRLTIQATLTLY